MRKGTGPLCAQQIGEEAVRTWVRGTKREKKGLRFTERRCDCVPESLDVKINSYDTKIGKCAFLTCAGKCSFVHISFIWDMIVDV